MTRLSRLPRHIRALNPDLDTQTRRQAAGQTDVADELLARLQILAPDLAAGAVRDQPAGPFKIDLAWPSTMVCCEVDGGQHAPGGGKHGQVRDYEKIRALVLGGWCVLRFHAAEVRDDPDKCIADIRVAIDVAKVRR